MSLVKNNLLKAVLILFSATALFLILTSNISSKNDNLSGQDPKLIRAENNFKEYCSSCHGALMQAFVDRKWKYGSKPDQLYKSISEGIGDSEAGMPSFGAALSEDEINELVEYIRWGIQNVNSYEFENEVDEDQIYTTEQFRFKLEKIADDLESPWGIAFLPNGDMLVTDKAGELWLIKEDKTKIEISGVPEVLYKGQGGLLDVELHPDFKSNDWVYLSYSKPKNEAGEVVSTTAVSRYKLTGNRLSQGETIFEALPYSSKSHHFGSRLEFDNEGYLFITVGDRGSRDVNPQDLSLFPGKVHRIFDDGRIPEDNPFYNKKGAVKSIYSYGHRNQQGMVKNPQTGEMWTHEHGPRGGDEINIIKKGLNYGWPVISYGINYDGSIFTNLTEKEGMHQPLIQWTPSIAPCGMDFVESDRYPGWQGNLLVGSLRYRYINLCRVQGDKITSQEILLENIGRVRQVKESPKGFIYVAVEDPGIVYKIVPL